MSEHQTEPWATDSIACTCGDWQWDGVAGREEAALASFIEHAGHAGCLTPDFAGDTCQFWAAKYEQPRCIGCEGGLEL